MYQEDWEKTLGCGSTAEDWFRDVGQPDEELDEIRELIGVPRKEASRSGRPGAASGGSAASEEDLFTQSIYALLDGPEPDTEPEPQAAEQYLDDPPREPAPRVRGTSREPEQIMEQPRTRASGCLIDLLVLELIGIGAVAVCWFLTLMQ